MASEPRFLVLEEEAKGPCHTEFVKPDGAQRGDAPKCLNCGEFIGMLEWLPPFEVELEVYGQDLGDLVHGAAADVLASERFMKAFLAENLTGILSFDPVKVVQLTRKRRGPKITSVPRYFRMKPCFGRAAVDEARSRLRRAEPLECAECRSPGVDGIYGFRFETGSWQGEDVFLPRGLQSRIVVSERFARFVRNHGFTNIKLTLTEEFTFDPFRLGPPAPPPRA